MKDYKEITLEMSLKPFRENTPWYIEYRAQEIFLQWRPLLKHGDRIACLLWIGDGSELLEYKGNLDETIEWGRYIGSANPGSKKHAGSEFIDPDDLHNRNHLYTESPPTFTYADVATIVTILKRVGRKITGREVVVGETFDPGPEFAVSEFKFKRHPEICMGEVSGWPFVGCYARLNADPTPFAGFPDGVPDRTPFGRFFGKQAQCFLRDLGFDYIWFSNGFGFGIEPWNTSGAVFDGERFDNSAAEEVKRLTLEFWSQFREACCYPIQTRGTNMATGIDLSSDAVPLREIYEQVRDLQPPPNSPWVSLDGDFGLELAGWMSHIARTPGEDFPFRFYTHDPWWANSPWLDRYERYPHDIHMPMSVSRIDADGTVAVPTILEFLTVDDAYGRTPDQVPNEVIPEILYSRDHHPDAPGPLVWVYPFDGYHDLVEDGGDGALEKVFFGDWYVRGAINRGLPLNTVVDQANLQRLLDERPELFAESVLVVPVLAYSERFYTALVEYIERGGRALLFGSLQNCPAFVRKFLSVELAEPLAGEFDIELPLDGDTYRTGATPRKLMHPALFSDGGISEVAAADVRDLMTVEQAGYRRTYCLHRSCDTGGSVVWVRGSNSFVSPITTRLPEEYDPSSYIRPTILLRHALKHLGYGFVFAGSRLEKHEPVQTVSRHRNAFRFSGFVPNTSSTVYFRFPWGVPVLASMDPEVEDNGAAYRFERAYTKECRIFVENQEPGTVVRCAELPAVAVGVKKRFLLRDLENADVTFFPEPGYERETIFYRDEADSHYRTEFPHKKENVIPAETTLSGTRTYLKVSGYTGSLLISW